MKRKFYLRGLGLGILVTSIVFIIAGPKELSDEDIIKRATELGYVKEESSSIGIKDLLNKETPKPTQPVHTVEIPESVSTPVPTPTISPTETPTPSLTPVPTNTPMPTPTNTPTPVPSNTPTPTPTNTPTPVPTEAPTQVTTANIVVEPGNSASIVCKKMEEKGIVNDGNEFRNYLVNRNLTDFINIGTFSMSSDMSFEELTKILTGK